MGQSQSSGRAASDAAREEGKADYYDLLGVEKTATDEEIKKAYRRKALELHPDRNYGNVEATTALFAEVQSAYEVLSDPQERAWYDSHRDGILYGHDEESGEQYCYNTKMTTADDVLKLFRDFNPRMEFSDSPSGFFGALRETFDQLAKEEELACKWDGLDPVYYPSFGSRDDGYDDVRPFYSVWTGFATKKSFAWKDVYKYSQAPDRRTRRLMEKENKRLRDEAIREFNYSVRSLVAFVKKRDPRWKAGVQTEAERQKSLRDAAAAQAARSRAAYNAKLGEHVVPEWAQATDEPELEGRFSSESETEQVHYECVVCGKDFKSEKQMEAHERSKKHIKAVKQLQREMKAEDKQFQQESDPEPADAEGVPQDSAPSERADSPNSITSDLDGTSTHGDLEDDVFHGRENEKVAMDQEENSADEVGDSESTDDDYASREAVEERLATTTGYAPADSTTGVEDAVSAMSISNEPSNRAEPKVGKAKQKRAKKAAQAAAGEAKSLMCAACQATFPSKTKLFNHIKELGHAQPVPNARPAKSGKKSSRR